MSRSRSDSGAACAAGRAAAVDHGVGGFVAFLADAERREVLCREALNAPRSACHAG
jgi:hypothetical protein